MQRTAWRQVVEDPTGEPHLVHLYRERSFLRQVVGNWVVASLARGGGAVLACAPENAALVRAEVAAAGLDAAALEREGRFVVLDADALMSRFVFEGVPDRATFLAIAADVLGKLRAACGPGREIRAWGEMVNLLWHRGNAPAARTLEHLWNEVIAAHGIRLLCSYEVDNLSPDTHAGALRAICEGHTQLLPEEHDERFELAVSRALADVFGTSEAETVRALFASRRSLDVHMPSAQAVLVALHEVQPELGRRVLAAARMHLESMA